MAKSSVKCSEITMFYNLVGSAEKDRQESHLVKREYVIIQLGNFPLRIYKIVLTVG